MNKIYIFGIIAILFIVTSAVGFWLFANQANTVVDVTKIGTILEGSQVLGFYVSPDSNSFAHRVKEGGKFSIVHNGDTGKSYDKVYGLIFSPDSKQYAYIAEIDRKKVFVLNGKEGNFYDAINKNPEPRFDSEGDFVYDAISGDMEFLRITNNIEGDSYLRSLNYKTSPSGKTFVVKNERDGKWFVDLLSKDTSRVYSGELYLSVFDYVWGPNEHLAYSAIGDDSMFFVIDGKEGRPYGIIYEFTWSQDGENYAYAAKFNDGKMVAVLDGEEVGDRYALVTGLEFSPDGKQLAYRGYYKNTGVDVIVNGEKVAKYDQVSNIAFSPDGTQFSYVAVENGKRIVVIDGETIGWYNMRYNVELTSPFSRDGKHFAYTVSRDGESFVVLNGKEGNKYDNVYISKNSFNEDEKTFSYLAILGSDILRVVNPL